jgi:hypothetical protein
MQQDWLKERVFDVNHREINKYLYITTNLLLSLQKPSNISSISTHRSLMLKNSFIIILIKVPVNTYSTSSSEYNVEFIALYKG